MRTQKAFTLLEIIIVIIIIGVLSALALPRLFNVIEQSRSVEATTAIASIRTAADRYVLMHPEDPDVFGSAINPDSWRAMGLEYPGGSANAHFAYGATVDNEGSNNAVRVAVFALRNCKDGGSPKYKGGSCDGQTVSVECSNMIFFGFNEDQNHTSLCGNGVYQNMAQGNGGCAGAIDTWWSKYGDSGALSVMLTNYHADLGC